MRMPEYLTCPECGMEFDGGHQMFEAYPNYWICESCFIELFKPDYSALLEEMETKDAADNLGIDCKYVSEIIENDYINAMESNRDMERGY